MTQEQAGVIVYESRLLSQAEAAGIDLTPLLAQIPEPDDDAQVRIIKQIMSAETVADLDAPYRARSLEEWLDRPVIVHDIHKMPSDFEEGLGFYLVADIQTDNTDARKVVTTGSVNVVVQLVRAYTMGGFPLTVIPREAKRATSRGYKPMHLEIVAAK